MGVTPNGLFIRENLIDMDDLGVLLFMETPIWLYIHVYMELQSQVR